MQPIVTVLFVQVTLSVLHVPVPSLVNNPCSTEGCEEGPRDGAERVKEAAVNDPPCKIDDSSNHSSLHGEYAHEGHHGAN